MRFLASAILLANCFLAIAHAVVLSSDVLEGKRKDLDRKTILGGGSVKNFHNIETRDSDKECCLTKKEAEDITSNWLGIFSGHPELLNTTLTSDVVVYDSLVNNGNLAPIATSRDEYYGYVMNFTYPKNGAITNTSYTLEGGGFMFHSCDKIAMRYIGHATCTGKFSVPAGSPVTVAVNQLLSVNKHKQIDIVWSEYDLFSMLKQIGVLKPTFDGI